MRKVEKVTIAEPCHEDWGKMTINEKGRFCNSCEKTVVDFTKNSPLEIHSYLKKNESKDICGRVNSTTINREIISNPRVERFNKLRLRTFVYACLLVFGPTLFSFTCEAQDKISLIELTENNDQFSFTKGEIQIVEDTTDTLIVDTVRNFLEQPIDLIEEIENFELYSTTLGFMVIEEDSIVQDLEEFEIVAEPSPLINCGNNIAGGMSIVSLEDIDTLEPIENILPERNNTEETATIKLYPNPSFNFTNLDVNFLTTENSKAKLEIFSINGKLMNSENVRLINGSLKNHQIDLTNLNAGTYIVNISTRNERMSSKIIISR